MQVKTEQRKETLVVISRNYNIVSILYLIQLYYTKRHLASYNFKLNVNVILSNFLNILFEDVK